jgi:sulfite reductase (ferredoxin)
MKLVANATDGETPMNRASLFELPDRIRKDVAGYRNEVDRFVRGEANPVAFRAYRVPMGVYEHRETGRYMTRVRLGAGLALPHQLARIAELSRQHGNGVVHATTRQDLQIHDLTIEGSIAVQEGLAAVGLSARGGGGNTVRNVTACPRASVCPRAQFDVAPHAIALAEYLLAHPKAFTLPRKYKIAFSGCADDCAFASVNDLGFFAHQRDGEWGFAVYAAGGLGAQPTIGIRLESFVAASQIFAVAEAILNLFDRLGDRSNKSQARLRYVLRRLGAQSFLAEYQKERERLSREGLHGTPPKPRRLAFACLEAGPLSGNGGLPGAPEGFLAERDPTRLTLALRLSNGRIPSHDLTHVADIARDFGAGVVVATQQQDLLVPGVAREKVEQVRAALATLSIHVAARGPKVVACAGASTCKLGLCHSPALADAIEHTLDGSPRQEGLDEIRLSGCPNNCGNHSLAALGFEGRARRHEGRLMPCYNVLAGGKVAEDATHLSERVGVLPARAVPDFVAEVVKLGLSEPKAIRALVERHAQLPTPIPEDYFVDWGQRAAFTLAGRGPGECGAGVLDIVRADLDESAESFARAATHPEDGDKSLRNAILATARALLPLFGVEARKEDELGAAVAQYLVEPGWVATDTRSLLEAVLDADPHTTPPPTDLLPRAKAFYERVLALHGSLDGALQFQVKPLPKSPTPNSTQPRQIADLRGVRCPLNFVKAKVALERVPLGEVLEILLDQGEPAENVPASFADQGQEIVSAEVDGECLRLKIRRTR